MKHKDIFENGFTLIELLVTMVLLGIVGGIIIFDVTRVSTDSKKLEYQKYIESVKSAASVYTFKYSENFNRLYKDKAYLYITVRDLIELGELDKDLVNPYTNKKIGMDELIKVLLDSKTGGMIYEYPVEDSKQETFLVRMDDNIVFGEPYNCMQGSGTYQLALSDEDGNLIDLSKEENISKYNFKCSMPNNFIEYTRNGNTVGYYTENPSNYEINYSWVTSNGVTKVATRNLLVEAKVEASYKKLYSKSKTEVNYRYSFSPNYYEDYGWDYLIYEPYVEGLNNDSYEYKITEKNGITGNIRDVTVGYVNEFKSYPASDGENTYTIDIKVHGHYDKEYYYETNTSFVLKSNISISSSLVYGTSNDYRTSGTLTITDTYSTAGISKYEYRIVNDNSKPNASDSVDESKTFTPDEDGLAKLNLSISTILDKTQEYLVERVYLRAINKDGFVGEWTFNPFSMKVTNKLDKLIKVNNSCLDANTCCYASSGTNGCYFTDKVKYIRYGSALLVVLYDDINSHNITAAYDGELPGKIKTRTKTNKSWVASNGDNVQNEVYDTNIDNLFIKSIEFLNYLPSDYSEHLQIESWSGYTSYVGIVNTYMFNKYGKALYSDKNYWTNSSYIKPFNYIYPPTGESKSLNHEYFYQVNKDTLSDDETVEEAYVKPVITLINPLTKGGDGSRDNPYIIS